MKNFLKLVFFMSCMAFSAKAQFAYTNVPPGATGSPNDLRNYVRNLNSYQSNLWTLASTALPTATYVTPTNANWTFTGSGLQLAYSSTGATITNAVIGGVTNIGIVLRIYNGATNSIVFPRVSGSIVPNSSTNLTLPVNGMFTFTSVDTNKWAIHAVVP